MKTLFLHMPKSAGSSKRKILKEKFKENYVFEEFYSLDIELYKKIRDK